MKPSVRSTAIAFIGVGLTMALAGPLGLLQLSAVLAGVGIYLQLRPAWWLGFAYSLTGTLAAVLWVVVGLLTGRGSWSFAFLVLPAICLVTYLYLLISVLFIRRELR